MTFDRAAYLARVADAVSDGVRNQQRAIAEGRVRDPNKPVRPRSDTPTEYQEQKIVHSWLKAHRIVHCAIPNGGKRTAIEGNQLRYIGISAGAPDLLVFSRVPKLPQCRGVAIEMKRRVGGRLTEEQLAWLAALAADNCAWVTFCAHGADEAIARLREMGFGS